MVSTNKDIVWVFIGECVYYWVRWGCFVPGSVPVPASKTNFNSAFWCKHGLYLYVLAVFLVVCVLVCVFVLLLFVLLNGSIAESLHLTKLLEKWRGIRSILSKITLEIYLLKLPRKINGYGYLDAFIVYGHALYV